MIMMGRRLALLAPLAVLLIGLIGHCREAEAAQRYRTRLLQPLPSGVSCHAMAINDAGQIVGQSDEASGLHKAVLWNPEGDVMDLGVLAGCLTSSATAINNNGWVVGYSRPSYGPQRGFLWRPDWGMLDLGEFIPHDINDLGQMACSSYRESVYMAFVVDIEAVPTYLGTLGGGDVYVRAINNRGDVTGYGLISAPVYTAHAFRWTSSTGMADIGFSAYHGTSEGWDINDIGQVAGRTVTDAVVWGANNEMWKLSLPAGCVYGAAVAINNRGQTLGAARADQPGINWAIWNTDGSLASLPSPFGDETFAARNINDSGLVVGWTNNSPFEMRAILWTPADSPVLEPPTGNPGFVLRNGRTVPVKFHLLDCDGAAVREKRTVTVVVSAQAAGDPSVTYRFSAEDGSLRFDGAGRYNAVFSLPKGRGLSGNCRIDVREGGWSIGGISIPIEIN